MHPLKSRQLLGQPPTVREITLHLLAPPFIAGENWGTPGWGFVVEVLEGGGSGIAGGFTEDRHPKNLMASQRTHRRTASRILTRTYPGGGSVDDGSLRAAPGDGRRQPGPLAVSSTPTFLENSHWPCELSVHMFRETHSMEL